MERSEAKHGEGGHESLVDRMQPYSTANSRDAAVAWRRDKTLSSAPNCLVFQMLARYGPLEDKDGLESDRRRVQTETRSTVSRATNNKARQDVVSCVACTGTHLGLGTCGRRRTGQGVLGGRRTRRPLGFCRRAVGEMIKAGRGDILCTRRTARRKACRLSSVARTAEARRVPGLTCNVSRKSANIRLEGCNEAIHNKVSQSQRRSPGQTRTTPYHHTSHNCPPQSFDLYSVYTHNKYLCYSTALI